MIRLPLYSALLTVFVSAMAVAEDDPYLWLEEVQDEKALDWARSQNEKTFTALKDTGVYSELYQEAYDILMSDARIPTGSISGDYYYNFWQDEINVRGLLRRTSITAFAQGQPKWEAVLDMDKLAADEDENWVWQSGFACVGGDSDRCLVEMSHGGKDESVRREFSLSTMSFVADGFDVPEAKAYVAWLGEDTLLIATDWGDGLTDSGYPLDLKIWKRGTHISDARSLLRIKTEETLLAPTVISDNGVDHAFALTLHADWNERQYMRILDDGSLEEMPWPMRTTLQGIIGGRLILVLEQDWETVNAQYSIGDVVAYDFASEDTELVFSPTELQAVSAVNVGNTSIFVTLLDNVVGRVQRLSRVDDKWQVATLELPDNGVASVVATSGRRDDAFVTYESAILPSTLYYVSDEDELSAIATLPHFYDAEGVVIEQRFATSSDGQKVPYFIVGDKDVIAKGDAPTILYGYGGFEIPILPVYYADPSRPQHGALAGRLWISRGGILALANLRGGGEFGPSWHQAGILKNRQLVYDDYFAIAEHMIDLGLTSSERLGALGRSNGGLLLGVAMTQRPDLFTALDIGVPLLDMMRYNKLLAGASWMGEYGNPDIPEDRASIEKWSPYQNVDKDQDYPTVLFYTSTLDDRVHPGHARKMAAKLEDLGQDFFYYENIEGGHGGTANQEQLAMRTALEYAYFVRMLMPAVWDRP